MSKEVAKAREQFVKLLLKLAIKIAEQFFSTNLNKFHAFFVALTVDFTNVILSWIENLRTF